jgi:(E)-4-hydroxy-3-methyl-but-2-enyl pyrophosphate reductase
MKIRLANTAGFCMGVRRAVDMVLDLQRAQPPLPIVTYGPLIHNPQTLELLKERGITEVQSLDQVHEGTVVVRAHGISPQERQILMEKGVGVVDATCPRVARVQAVIRKHAARGEFCVIVGDRDHPEVKGLLGFASAGGVAVPNPDVTEILDAVPCDRDICIVAQTTQEVRTFDRVVEILRERCREINVYNTICDSTKKRQSEVARLARQVETIIVVGGKGSGNTARLLKVAQGEGVPAIHVETDEEINSAFLEGVESVGVTAGASTPNWMIRQVIDRLREIGMSRRTGPLAAVRRIADVAVMTYCWAAMGAAGLTATCLVLQNRPVTWLPLAVAMLFVFSMHLLNRIQERSGAVRFNTPEIAAFYARHRSLLTTLAAVSCLMAVVLCSWMGTYSCLLLVAMIVTGGLYAVPLLSRLQVRWLKWKSLRDLPGSKTPLVAAGWAMAAAVLPAIGSNSRMAWSGLIVSFVFAAGMVFWRTALSDLLDIQGDRIVGRETIPILIGVKKTRKLLLGLLIFLATLLGVAGAAGWIPRVGLALILSTAIFGVFFFVYRKRHLVDRLAVEALIDGNFVLAGLLCLVYG